MALIVGALLSVGACVAKRPASTDFPPPPDADLRPLTQPVLEVVTGSAVGGPEDYPQLISAILASELSSIFNLPQDTEARFRADVNTNLVPVLDAVTDGIIIPMLFDALDPRQKALIAEASPRMSLGDREHVYRLIIDVAMARMWQAASGDLSDREGYLQHLATRSGEADDTSFITWHGGDGAVWKARIKRNLQPSGHPFAVLGMMTSHYLHTHIFSIISYLVARSFSETIIDSEFASRADELTMPRGIDELTAVLMDRAMLPLMGIDWLLSIADHRAGQSDMALAQEPPTYAVLKNNGSSRWRCAGWNFFTTARQRLFGNIREIDSQSNAHQTYAARMATRLREQEGRVGRHLSSFLSGHVDNPIRFAGFDIETWESLSIQPIDCLRGQRVEIAAEADPRNPSKAMTREQENLLTSSNDHSCSNILDMAGIISDDHVRSMFCRLAEQSFPSEATILLLENIESGRFSDSELSAIFVGLQTLRDETETIQTKYFRILSRELSNTREMAKMAPNHRN